MGTTIDRKLSAAPRVEYYVSVKCFSFIPHQKKKKPRKTKHGLEGDGSSSWSQLSPPQLQFECSSGLGNRQFLILYC